MSKQLVEYCEEETNACSSSSVNAECKKVDDKPTVEYCEPSNSVNNDECQEETKEDEMEYIYVEKLEIDPALICSICKDPVVNPQQNVCGHMFCKNCTSGKPITKCPNCNAREWSLSPVTLVYTLKSLKELKVKCPHCKAVVERGQLKEHLTSCPLFSAREELKRKQEFLQMENQAMLRTFDVLQQELETCREEMIQSIFTDVKNQLEQPYQESLNVIFKELEDIKDITVQRHKSSVLDMKLLTSKVNELEKSTNKEISQLEKFENQSRKNLNEITSQLKEIKEITSKNLCLETNINNQLTSLQEQVIILRKWLIVAIFVIVVVLVLR